MIGEYQFNEISFIRLLEILYFIEDKEHETQQLLPVVLVLIEGGISALETTKSVLTNGHHVVVIEGSGGVADVFAAYHRASRFVHLT